MSGHRRIKLLNSLRSGISVLIVSLSFVLIPSHSSAREKDGVQYGAGLVVNVPFPESDVERVVASVAQNGIIRGTKEYNKDQYIAGADERMSSNAFPDHIQEGIVFYKVKARALDPRNFKDGGDLGTLTVRYVLLPQGDKNTILRINAIFVEDFRHSSHPSNGSVEQAEYKDIHDRLESMQVMREQTAEIQRERESAQTGATETQPETTSDRPATGPASSYQPHSVQHPAATAEPYAPASVDVPHPLPAQIMNVESASGGQDSVPAVADETQNLEQRVKKLRQELERVVKVPGAPLKSAPFHTASTLQLLGPGTEVLIEIATPYWLGIETHEGQHGWIMKDELEQKP